MKKKELLKAEYPSIYKMKNFMYSIGKKSIIGAASVVLDNVKSTAIYFGNPAKFYKKIDIHNRPKL